MPYLISSTSGGGKNEKEGGVEVEHPEADAEVKRGAQRENDGESSIPFPSGNKAKEKKCDACTDTRTRSWLVMGGLRGSMVTRELILVKQEGDGQWKGATP